MAVPLIESVRDSGAETVVMCGPTVQELLGGLGPRVRFANGEKISGIGPVLRASRAIRELNVDVAYIVNRSFRSALAVRLARVKRRIGHSTEGRGFLLTSALPYDGAKFEAECYLDLLRPAKISPKEVRPRLTVAPSGERFDFGIQPGARYVEKQVPVPVMFEVAEALLTMGLCGVILGGTEEARTAAEFANRLSKPTECLAGKLSIRETMGVLAGLRTMIGSDTGLMHVAAAVGCPTVTVFGPNPASKWGHRYEPHEILEAPQGKMDRVGSAEILAAAERTLAVKGRNRVSMQTSGTDSTSKRGGRPSLGT